MEQLNRVELRGIVGAARATKVGNRHMVRFSLATNLAYKDQEGGVVIETQWSNMYALKVTRFMWILNPFPKETNFMLLDVFVTNVT